jgi:mannose-6-phosphate isomerase-like protein (cupin superfamily)
MAVETPIQPQRFRLRAPLLRDGRLDVDLAETPNLTVGLKVYAVGGENTLHTHVAEDHFFLVLDGQARFYGRDGELGVLGRYEGILLPQGCFYWFEQVGDRPLVMLRVGTGREARRARIGIDGRPLPGDSPENKHVPPVIIPGAFFE